MNRALPWMGVIVFSAAAGIAGGIWGRSGELVFLLAAALLCLVAWGVTRYLEHRHAGMLAEIIVDISDLDRDAQDEILDQLPTEDQAIVRDELSASFNSNTSESTQD